MSGQLTEEVYTHSQATGPAKRLLLAMAHVCDEGRLCYMGNAELMRRAELSLRGLYEARAQLVELAEIQVAEKGGGRGKNTTYTIPDLRLIRASHRTDSAPNHAATRRVSAPETVRAGGRNRAGLTRAGEDGEREREKNSTPLGPPKGGQGERDLHEVGTASSLGADLWARVVEDLRVELPAAGLIHLESLTPERENGTLRLAGASAGYCDVRFGRHVTAAAERHGVVVEFQPQPSAVPTRGRQRRQRRRAA